jgi:cation transport ATPase
MGNGDAVADATDVNQFDPELRIARRWERRISHPITRALHDAYRAAGGPPSQDSLAAMLAKLDVMS